MTPFTGTVWRILFAAYADEPVAPARAPEGRFRHDGQLATYTSLSAEGAGTAIQRYLTPDDPPRVIISLTVSLERVLDLRGDMPAKDSVPPTSVVWQDQRAVGLRASTWDISDRAITLGAQGILYRSRTHPALHHLVLLGPTNPNVLSVLGPVRPWP